MLIVDTNVLLDVVENDPKWADWSASQLDARSSVHELIINPVIYAELSLAFSTVPLLDRALLEARLQLHELPRAALFLAGRAFVKYRRSGGVAPNVLPDFFIGAHAAVLQCGILTRDASRYRAYFPTVPLITP